MCGPIHIRCSLAEVSEIAHMKLREALLFAVGACLLTVEPVELLCLQSVKVLIRLAFPL